MKHYKILTLLAFIFLVSIAKAQIGQIDTSFNSFSALKGSFTSALVQPDKNIVLAGNLSQYYNRKILNIVRLHEDGAIDNSFRTDVGTNGAIYSMALQSDGKIIIGGTFTYFADQPFNYIMRLLPSGVPDMSFNPGKGANEFVSKVYLQPDGKIILAGAFTSYDGKPKKGICRINSDGSIDNTFNLTSEGSIECIHFLNNGSMLIGGAFTKINGISKNGIARVFKNGDLDTLFKVKYGFDKEVDVIKVQADDKILVGGKFKMYDSISSKCIIRLESDGAIDTSFHTGTGFFNDGFAGMNREAVFDILIQPDQKIVAGGWFQGYNGTSQSNLIRLNPDGSVDATFQARTDSYNNSVNTLVLQSDGKILLCGNFNTINDFKRGRCGRVAGTNGAIDEAFLRAKGPDGIINSIKTTTSGKVLVTGNFNNYNGIPCKKIALLNSKGEPDLSFKTGNGFDQQVLDATIQADGNIILTGHFTTYNSVTAKHILRIDSLGNIDNTFNSFNGFDNVPIKVRLQADGKILVIGKFTSYNGVDANKIIRLNPDGSIDNSFTTGTSFNNSLTDFAIQTDGKIVVIGEFTSYNEFTCNKVARLNADGTFDHSFNSGSGPDYSLKTIGIQPSGKIIIGGYFTRFSGIENRYLIRLDSYGNIDLSFPSNTMNINTILIEPSGSMLLGGTFPSQNAGSGFSRLVKLLPDGNKDYNFNPDFFYEVSSCNAIDRFNNGDLVAYGNFNNPWINQICKVFGNPVGYNTITTRIYTDRNKNCYFDQKDKFIPQILFKATPGNFYGVSDWYGQAAIKVDSGTHTYRIEPIFNPINQRLLISQCPNQTYYNVLSYGKDKTFAAGNFADSIKQCHLLNVEIDKARIRPCMRSATYISYYNHGNVSADNVQLKIIYPSYVKPISSSPAWTNRVDSILIYDIGTVLSAAGGRIVISDSASCIQSITGLTQCISAFINPKNNCDQENVLWDKSSISVRGSCLDSKAHFTITNEGKGNMSDSSQYRVYQNDTLIFYKNFSLTAGGILNIDVNSFNKTTRLEADQRPYHPGFSRPRAFVENCGSGPSSPGFVTSVPQDERDEETASVCLLVRNSFDPNDKVASPEGSTNFHYIKSSDKINYTINFQNTGTDTAFVVKVVDTLDTNLDISTFMTGLSSHHYTLKVEGKERPIISFVFNNILLPDSTTNKEGSKGFIKFSVRPIASLAPGEIISNNANIYFDFNEPVITNVVSHTITDTTIADLSRKIDIIETPEYVTSMTSSIQLSNLAEIYPNPANNFANVKLSSAYKDVTFRLLTTNGVCLINKDLNDQFSQVNLKEIPTGLYFYEMRTKNGLIQIGKLILQ